MSERRRVVRLGERTAHSPSLAKGASLAAVGANPSPRERGGKVVLDWKGYFVEFCRVHGEPVEMGGRLVFRDGWSYSATDYEGPEWPPPPKFEELDELVFKYWVTRQGLLSRLLATLTHQLGQLEDLTKARSLPVQQQVVVDTDAGKRRGYRPLDLSLLRSKVAWVRADLEEAESRLKEIEQHYKKKDGAA